MAWDEAVAQRIRTALGPLAAETVERKMFGGLCFLLRGHMLGGASGAGMGGGALLRVGPEGEAEALALPGVAPMILRGRPMRGFVKLSPQAAADPGTLPRLVALAAAFTAALPPK
ncbi:TfoX/Sxy family protein [Albimonas pacifica]|uniref:TfoX N-terminal domain-containing protein n=1 Tax=Albimonas pacifica TaxID=1114924 RepID=A0A1I3GFD9_9RHOB|nr:TfoX/Sxy family protein [Albimonas pacifica]SFI22179.1 TfoX N-terminal domain-containing protein [Albimonas pacifica]